MNRNTERPDTPDELNYFAEVHTRDRDDVAAAFTHDSRWSIRKAGFGELEAQSTDAELTIEAEEQVLVHGPLHPNAITGVNKILASLGLPWKSEVYDHEGKIVQSFGDAVA